MKPPSRTEKGGSSTMARPMSSRSSVRSSSSSRREASRAEEQPASRSRRAGSLPRPFARATRSRPPAVP